ncbi:MAG: hypothetical protein ACXWKN_11855 [Phenylobacterium sp.]
MKKTILTILALTCAASALSACVEYRGGPPPRVVAEREGWIPGHYDHAGFWIPGHWR